jgi:hypothetical protein
MTSRSLFRIAVKLVGIIVLLQGLSDTLQGVMILLGCWKPRLTTAQYWAVTAVLKMGVGVYLVIWASPLVELAFPVRRRPKGGAGETTRSREFPNSNADGRASFTPSVLFGLVVKTLGLIICLYALQDLLGECLAALAVPEGASTGSKLSFVFNILKFLAGLGMMLRTGLLVDFVMQERPTKLQSEDGQPATPEEGSDA